MTGLWPKKCSKLKNACTKNKIWRDDRKQPSNRHHITQNLNVDIFFLITLYLSTKLIYHVPFTGTASLFDHCGQIRDRACSPNKTW